MVPLLRSRSNKRLARVSLEKRTKTLSHVQKPRAKQKKMTDFFPPSPKFNGNKSFTMGTTIDSENQPPRLSFNGKGYETETSPQKRTKKAEPRNVPHSSSSVTPSKMNSLKDTKHILKENGINIQKSEIRNGNDKKYSPKKSPVKSQRNARKLYLKYGTRVPSFNDIVKSHKEFLKFKEIVASVAELQKDPLQQHDEKSSFPEKCDDADDLSHRLDCKHLAKEKLADLFQQHTALVIGIGNATIPCARHDLYIQNPFGTSEFDRGELTFNISMPAFSSKQKMILANMVRKTFVANNLSYNNQYYFKVILPELCLKIFMQEYNLTSEEATEYLSNPILT